MYQIMSEKILFRLNKLSPGLIYSRKFQPDFDERTYLTAQLLI